MRIPSILAATILATAAATAPASAQYAPPKGQSQAAAMADESIILSFCTPGGSRSPNTLPAWRAPTQAEMADYLADRIGDRLAPPPQVDAECVARIRAMRAANPTRPSTLYAVAHDSGGYTALYTGGTHTCGDRQPLVIVTHRGYMPTYGCWKLTTDRKGTPAVSLRMDHGKSGLWKASHFKRPDGSAL